MTTERVTVVLQPEVRVVEVGQPGRPGKDGADGLGALSPDPNNRATTDGEGALLVPDLTIDPLAYYILARS